MEYFSHILFPSQNAEPPHLHNDACGIVSKPFWLLCHMSAFYSASSASLIA